MTTRRLALCFALSFALAPQLFANPTIKDILPGVVGMGGKLIINGEGLGTADNTVVIFTPNLVATQPLWHHDTQIGVRVPFGSTAGFVRVVTGVNAAAIRDLQDQIDRIEGIDTPEMTAEVASLESQKSAFLGGGSTATSPSSVMITFGFYHPIFDDTGNVDAANGVPLLLGRVIVDLVDWESFDTAADIGQKLNADLIGYIPFTNSYVFQLHQPAANASQLETIINSIQSDRRVTEAWPDIALDFGQVRFSDSDWVDRYRQTRGARGNPSALNGREDAWPTDRIQAPGAWNLIERWVPARDGLNAGAASLQPITMAVADSGVDQTHPEFANVSLKKVQVNWAAIAGFMIPIGYQLVDYADGDPVDRANRNRQNQHGTGVAALMGAANGAALPGAPNGDRGINGMVYNPMPYKIIVTKIDFPTQLETLSDYFQAFTDSLLGRARVLNTSFGQGCPINPATNPRSMQITTALRKLEEAMIALEPRVLLVTAAMNCGGPVPPVPGADRIDGRVYAFEGKGGPRNNGNSIAASLGFLPNVFATGAIGTDDGRAEFSNQGDPIQIWAPGVAVLVPGISFIDNFLYGPSFQIGDNMFYRVNGTSFAAPLVSGTAALLTGINPRLTPAQLKNYIKDTAMQIDGRNTLKAGYAVRQVLLDQGLIKNDDPFTGVTKVLTASIAARSNVINLFIAETRRRADGRAEAFAVRTLDQGGNPLSIKAPIALTHDGRRVSYTPAAKLSIDSYQFDTAAFSTLFTLPANTFGVNSTQYTPNGKLLAGSAELSNMGDCRAQVQLIDPAANPVTARLLTNSAFQRTCTFNVEKVVSPPSNRFWALNYRVYDARQQADLYGFKEDLPLNGVTAFPLAPSVAWRWYSYSPDGFAVTYAEWEDNAFHVTFQQGIQLPTVPVPGAGPRATVDSAWSPDGSEAAWTNGNEIQSARRDATRPIKFYDFGVTPYYSFRISWQW